MERKLSRPLSAFMPFCFRTWCIKSQSPLWMNQQHTKFCQGDLAKELALLDGLTWQATREQEHPCVLANLKRDMSMDGISEQINLCPAPAKPKHSYQKRSQSIGLARIDSRAVSSTSSGKGRHTAAPHTPIPSFRHSQAAGTLPKKLRRARRARTHAPSLPHVQAAERACSPPRLWWFPVRIPSLACSPPRPRALRMKSSASTSMLGNVHGLARASC